jgi:hypothetical protein
LNNVFYLPNIKPYKMAINLKLFFAHSSKNHEKEHNFKRCEVFEF